MEPTPATRPGKSRTPDPSSSSDCSNKSYQLWLESERGTRTAIGAPVNFTTAPLPADLAEVDLQFDGTPTEGYSLANIKSSAGHGYAVIFDSRGALRWYRDFGEQDIFGARQQTNGNFTVFAGSSNGYTPSEGAFVEVTPAGDSVRSITALGSTYTDPHELVTSFDRHNQHVADYLFGYDIGTVGFATHDLDGAETLALHQVLRIDAAGVVDTLIDAHHWSLSDAIEPPELPDLDHPNSIDFDLDGGVIVSYRSLSAVVKIDPETRAVVWQLGGVKNQFRFVNDPLGGFDGQHTVRVLPDGHFLIFDNGWTHTPQMSRAVEYALDTKAMTATMVWQYRANPPIFNDYTGSVERLVNGNTVVGFTREGTFDEVQPDGKRISRGVLSVKPKTAAMPYRVLRIRSLYDFIPP